MKNDIKGEVTLTINADKSKVWDALTQPEMIKQYFFGTNTKTSWQPGSPIIFEGEWQGKKYHDKGTVLDFEPNRLVRYNYWSSMSGIEDKPENYVIVTYSLSGSDGNVQLTVTEENIPDEKMKDHSIENWKKVMEDMKKLVEKGMPASA